MANTTRKGACALANSGAGTELWLPLVRAGAVLNFIRFLEELGSPVDRYLADFGLSYVSAGDPEDLVPLRPALKLVERAAAAEGIENMGLLVGERLEIRDLGAVGGIIGSAATLLSAFTSAVEVINLYGSGDRLWLANDGDNVLFCHHYLFAHGDEARHGSSLTVMTMIKIVRLVAGPTWWPREIRLPKREVVRQRYYESRIPASIVFHDHAFHAIVIPRTLLACRMPSTGSIRAPAGDAAGFLRSTAPKIDLVGSVGQAIAQLLPAGYPNIALVAEASGLEVRTFQRRLAQAGTSYRRLVEQARFEKAVELLSVDSATIIQIALELGFSDAANFTRAFRSWTGYAPRNYRRQRNMGTASLPRPEPRPREDRRVTRSAVQGSPDAN